MERSQYLEAGRIVNTHGLHGEIKIEPWDDGPLFFRQIKTLYIDGSPIRLLSSRPQGTFVLARLEGIEDLGAAMRLKNKIISIDRDEAPLPEGSFFLADLIGLSVVSDAGEPLGRLTEVLQRPANNVYVVRGERERLIPAVPEFIVRTDIDSGVMTVHLIKGM